MLNTSRDVEYEKNGIEMDELRNISLDMIKSIRDFRYDELKTKSAAEAEKWFNELGVEIDTEEDWDIISTRYALFKTRVFTPINDYRMNIDAKGLSSSRYRGHSFWDTEACVIPYFLMSKPELAKQLLESDYFMRESAIKKASDLGRKGYAWPWESAWKEHGEACSKLSYVDINTGEKVKSKIYHTQIHRGVDIILAVEQYYNSTKDKAFLEEKGLDLIFGSIEFYLDRVEFDGNKGKYVLLEVTGPNEYKEDVNNNTFLNQMLKHSLELAIKLIEDDSINKTNLNYDLVSLKERMLNLSENIYIPSTNSNGIIPENDTFDKLPVFDMEQYRKDLADPNFENIYNSMYFNKFQLIKQADIVMLFNNLPDLYNHDTMKRNFDYYEPLTMHDSSLSNIFHAIVASKIGEDELGYEFFKKATKTDLGDNMSSCDDGIHAASLTAIMLIVYRGFLGVDTFGGELKINPRLPKNWNSISGNLWFKNRRFKINVKGAEVELSPLDGNNNPIKAIINGIEKEFNF